MRILELVLTPQFIDREINHPNSAEELLLSLQNYYPDKVIRAILPFYSIPPIDPVPTLEDIKVDSGPALSKPPTHLVNFRRLSAKFLRTGKCTFLRGYSFKHSREGAYLPPVSCATESSGVDRLWSAFLLREVSF